MEIYANFKQKVSVDPIEVIAEMINNEIGSQNWVFENGKYYLGWEESRGAHSSEEQSEISKERYDYVTSLKHVLKYLKNKKMSNFNEGKKV